MRTDSSRSNQFQNLPHNSDGRGYGSRRTRYPTLIASIDQQIATRGSRAPLGRVIIVDGSYTRSNQPITIGMFVDLRETRPKLEGHWLDQLRADTNEQSN